MTWPLLTSLLRAKEYILLGDRVLGRGRGAHRGGQPRRPHRHRGRGSRSRWRSGSPSSPRSRCARRSACSTAAVHAAIGGLLDSAIATETAVVRRAGLPRQPRPHARQVLLTLPSLWRGEPADIARVCHAKTRVDYSGSSGGSSRDARRSSPRLLGEDGARAEELVEHQDAPQVAVQVVLGGEADAGEHLLAVRAAVRALRPAVAFAMAAVTGVGSSHAASRRPRPVSIATSVSARRCRTAWNFAIGWSNWIALDARARAPARALAGTRRRARARARRCAELHRRVPVDRRGASTRRRPRRGPRPTRDRGRCRAPTRVSSATRRRSRPRARHQRATTSVDGRDRGREAMHRRRGRRERRCAADADRREHDRGVAVELAPERERDDVDRAPTSRAQASPCSSNSVDTAARGSNDSASCQPSSATRGVERVAGVLFGRVAQAALEQLEVFVFDPTVIGRSRGRAGGGR